MSTDIVATPAVRTADSAYVSRFDGMTRFLRLAGFAAMVATAFFPYFATMVFNPGFIAAGGLAVYAIAELLRRGRLTAWLPYWAVVTPIGFAATYLLGSSSPIELAQMGPLPDLVRDAVLLIPTGIAAGIVAATDPRIRQLFAVVRIAALLSAGLALIEFVRGAQLFPGNALDKIHAGNSSVDALLLDGGGIRAIVAADHPLVLAALLAATVPLALASTPRWRGICEALILAAGIRATDSDGPLGLALLAIVVSLFVARRPLGATFGRWASRAVPIFGIGFLAFCATLVPVIDPDSPLDPSSQYRFGLYSLIPRIFVEHPFGYGAGIIPRGELLIEQLAGTIDVARTVDSELVLSVIQYGILGYVTYFAIVWLSVRASFVPGATRIAAVAALMITVTGFFLALHVWVSVLPIWAFLLGIAIFAVLRGRNTPSIDGKEK